MNRKGRSLSWLPRLKELQRKQPVKVVCYTIRNILQADVFNHYELLFSAGRQGGTFIEVPCRPHTCHNIHDICIRNKSTTTEEAPKRISELYAIRYNICRSSASERLTLKLMQTNAEQIVTDSTV